MPKDSKKKSKSSKKDGKKFQVKLKKPSIKIQKPNWKNIKESKVTKYSLMLLLILLFFVAIDFGVQYLNNDYSAAVVNGDRITNSEYYYRLDQAYGNAIVSQLIEEELVRQEAARQGVVATQEEIEAEVEDITEQVGGEEQLNASLDAYNLTMEDLTRQIELDILSRKMLEPTIEYTEEDVMAFFEEYSEMIFPEDAAELEEGELLDYESYKEETLDVYLQQEIETAKGPWLAELETESRIQNNVAEDPSYKLLGATRNIISNIWDQINSNEGDTEADAETESGTETETE
jgi:foldase protein PrsA